MRILDKYILKKYFTSFIFVLVILFFGYGIFHDINTVYPNPITQKQHVKYIMEKIAILIGIILFVILMEFILDKVGIL